jgi:hypothetical protein
MANDESDNSLPGLGTRDKPFLESSAKCSFCLDLKKQNLSRQWRKFSRLLPPIDSPYHITIKSLRANVERTKCPGCTLVNNATEHIIDQNGRELDFQNLTLEYIEPSSRGSDGGLSALSLQLSAFLPAKDKDATRWQMVNGRPDLDVRMFTGPSAKSPTREWVHRVSTPRYEIFVSDKGLNQDARDEPVEDHSTDNISWDAIGHSTLRCGASPTPNLLAFVRSNLDHCNSTHALCRKGDDSQWSLPTRVLDVGVHNTSDDGLVSNPTLYVSKPGQQESYLCLSHCWGTSDKNAAKPLETRKVTLSTFQQPNGIEWSGLTKTFQEAVTFTRKLGIRYLWIDSLCIVQDDVDDWAREAGKMASIYENATLTLAAAASANSHAGLFRGTGPTIELNLPSDGGDGFGLRESMCLRQLPNPSFFDYNSSGKNEKHVSPLLKRAWVYQERILSRRVLFFTPLEAVFECGSATKTDSDHDWVDSDMKHKFAETVYADSQKVMSFHGVENKIDQINWVWRHLVTEFTHLGLTMEKDTLPAMAGIAKRLQIALNGQDNSNYLAGLWRQTLIQDLLWEVSDRRKSTAPRVNHSIPSWSWARTDAPKTYNLSQKLTHLCDFVDGNVQSAPRSNGPGDPLVSVTSGYIVLSGYLIPARTEGTYIYTKHNARAEQLVTRDYDWRDPGDNQINDGDELFALPLVAQSDSAGAGQHSISVVCAVLRPVPGVKGTFTRVGLFSASSNHLRGHEYIFEGNEVLQLALQGSVDLGESLLQDDGLYKDDDTDIRGTSAQKDGEWISKRSRLAMEARYLYACLYGGEEAEIGFKDFLGLPHLGKMRDSLYEERSRFDEWRKRDKAGQQQVKSRTEIRLV